MAFFTIAFLFFYGAACFGLAFSFLFYRFCDGKKSFIQWIKSL